MVTKVGVKSYELCCASSEGRFIRGTRVVLINLSVCDCGMRTTLNYLLPRSKGDSVCISHSQTSQENCLLTFWNISLQLFSRV